MFDTYDLCFTADNTISLPGIDKSKAYQNSASPQYLDDADEVLHKEVLSGYGDLLVSQDVWIVHC